MNLKEIFLDLLNIQSYLGEEKQISEHVFNLLEEKGLSPKKINDNIICELDQGKDKTVALVGHLDTINPGMPMPVEEKDGIIYGLGAVDMKSGLASMIKLTEDVSELPVNIKLVFYTGEEGPLPNGVNKLLDSNAFEGVDLAFILEPTNSELEFGCMGTLSVKYTFNGKEAHSAYYWEGDNSIYNSLDFIKNISEINIPQDKYREGINITRIETVGALNQIPSKCHVYVNYRFAPELSGDEAKEKLKSFTNIEGEVLDLSLGGLLDLDKLDFNLDKSNFKVSQFWTDAAQLIGSGIPSINFGPGNPRLAHKKEEHISVLELNDYYNKLLETLRSL